MLIKQGLRLVHSGSVTQANIKLATVNAGAMIDISVDWSAYAGNDAGSTPYMLILYDSSGKRMQGFIGASGGGETLGAELITVAADREFSSDTGWWTIQPGWSIGGGVATCDGTAEAYIYRANLLIEGALYLGDIDLTAYTSGLLFIRIGGLQSGGFTTIATHSLYATDDDNLSYHYRSGYAPNAFVGSIDNASVKRVTDISVQGVHLHSTRGGTNRNVASIDSGFDLVGSAGYTFNIYSCP